MPLACSSNYAVPGTVVRPLIGGPICHVRLATLAGIGRSRACDAMVAALREASAPLVGLAGEDAARSGRSSASAHCFRICPQPGGNGRVVSIGARG